MRLPPRHRVHGEIASGGMATVYLASFAGAGEITSVTAALKRLHPHLAKVPAFRRMLLDEARLSARVMHPNVVRTLDVLGEGDDIVIAMEYALGLTLIESVQRALERAGSVDLAVASGIVVGMLHGLDAAHEATGADGVPLAIVHRDVSPQNVIVGANGVPRLLDFGIAKARDRLTTTEEGVAKGKRGYMAPEQLTGEPVGRATDIFSAGVVLWELIAGERLFDADDPRSGLAKRIREDVTLRPSERRPSDAAPAPSGLDDVILRSLRRQPHERFASAREMADALAAAVPPAGPAQIAAWLEQIAGDELAVLRARVVDVERFAADSDADTLGSGDDVTVVRDPWLPRGHALVVAARTPRRAPRTRRYVGILLAVSLIAIAGAVAGKAMTARASMPERPLSSSREAPALSAQAAPTAVEPATSGMAEEVVASEPSDPPVVGAWVAGAVPGSTRGPVAAPRRPAAAVLTKSKTCSPPYTFDRDGHKIYKPECY